MIELRMFLLWMTIAVIVSSTISGLTVTILAKPRIMPQGEVTQEELEKTKLILDYAERNCKKSQWRVEGGGAFVSVICGWQK
jgi:hypothetical protein